MATAQPDSDSEVQVRSRVQQAQDNRDTTQQQRSRFPLSYKEGLSQWWTNLTPAATEHRVLSFVPFLQQPPTHTQTGSAPVSASPSSTDLQPTGDSELYRETSITDPHGKRRWHSELVTLPGKNRALNEFSIERVGEEVENNLVMLHGYGAGLGFFYKNFEALSRAPGWKLYALDLLGMGRSSRPPFRIQAKDRQGKITEAENWFIDALEEWRQKRKIEKFTLLGHSLGGYMAVAYALKYPGHLNKLILASPVGIPEDPYAVNEDLPDPQDSTMVNEFTQDQDQTTSGTTKEPPRRPYPKWLVTLWDANLSPFSIVRWAGPLGPRLVSGWTARRFSHLPEEQAKALHDYSYSLFRQRGSGEYALAYILAPGAFARSPLIRRIQGVGRQWITPHAGPTADFGPADAPPQAQTRPSESHETNPNLADQTVTQQTPSKPLEREHGFPVVLMYGDNDWMDVKGGYAARDKILELKKDTLQDATAEEKKRDEGGAKVIVVPNAGHHLYLDGSEYFNDRMMEEMNEVNRRTKRRST